MLLGAGTVLDVETARHVIQAGARFVVSPVFKPDLIEEGHRRNVPVIPGCFTPTEILAAWEAGADIVKVFPASALGPTFFKEIRGPLPEVRLMPTGGVTRDNAGDWIRAGASLSARARLSWMRKPSPNAALITSQRMRGISWKLSG